MKVKAIFAFRDADGVWQQMKDPVKVLLSSTEIEVIHEMNCSIVAKIPLIGISAIVAVTDLKLVRITAGVQVGFLFNYGKTSFLKTLHQLQKHCVDVTVEDFITSSPPAVHYLSRRLGGDETTNAAATEIAGHAQENGTTSRQKELAATVLHAQRRTMRVTSGGSTRSLVIPAPLPAPTVPRHALAEKKQSSAPNSLRMHAERITRSSSKISTNET